GSARLEMVAELVQPSIKFKSAWRQSRASSRTTPLLIKAATGLPLQSWMAWTTILLTSWRRERARMKADLRSPSTPVITTSFSETSRTRRLESACGLPWRTKYAVHG
ncbi:hypothetical protein KEM56_006002, partial [Ascosphaera pollenicola]